jgi:hypothetical protein
VESAPRKLTVDEKQRIEADVMAREQAAHPGSTISVDVDDYTGADGEPKIRIMRIDIEMPPPPPPPPSAR